MADKIQGLFIDPPIAIARLGASTRPVDCFFWQDAANPHLQTVVAPTWTLDVEADGSVWPRMPDQLRFRDGNLVRPVAPFFEVWALVDADGSSELTETPLTPALLEDLITMFPAPFDGTVTGSTVDHHKLVIPFRLNRRQDDLDAIDLIQGQSHD